MRILRLDIPASVVIAARAGETTAVTTLFRTAWTPAYRIAWSVLGNATDAEDAAQSACVRAVAALTALRDPERFAPWFYRIVVNEAKQLRRARAREIPVEPDRGGRDVEAHEDRLDLRRAIDALDADLRATIVLRYYLDMSSADIGRILSISPVTARWRLMIAHRKLRALLEPPKYSELSIAPEASR